MKEEYLLSGSLEPTNEGYALAKIVGLKLAKYYYKQHYMRTICLVPCNIYGNNYHFDLKQAHVLSSLVWRFVDVQDEGTCTVTLWETGKPRREFIHIKDVAEVLLFLMNNHNSPDIINVGTGTDISIHNLANLISKEVGYAGEIEWDTRKPDGMLRKFLDFFELEAMSFHSNVSLEEGIRWTIVEYRQHKAKGAI